MKINKIMLPVAVVGAMCASCDDTIMEWGTPNGQTPVTTEELPLSVKEVIANYGNIKDYAAQYTPNMVIGLGFGAQQYIDNMEFKDGITYRSLVDSNFQMVTPGNAMKHDAIVTSAGGFNFATVDKMLETMPTGMSLYGHNFFWHTQQNQNYLKSLIAPTLVVESDSDIEGVLGGDASNFDGGSTGGWGSWGSNKQSGEVVADAGEDGSACLVLAAKADGNAWEAQCAYTFDTPLEKDVEYTIRFKAKSDAPGELQFQYQNGSTYGSQGGYNTFYTTTSWATYEYSFTITQYDDVNRILINFGKVGTTYYIDDIEFGTAKQGPTNYCSNGSFEDGIDGWTVSNAGDGVTNEEVEGAIAGSKALKLVASASSANAWDLQVTSEKIPTMPGKKVQLSFYIKSDQAGKGRVSFSSDMSNQWPWMNWTGKQDGWTEAFETSTSWTYINVVLQNFSCDFKEGSDTWQFNLDLGYLPGVTYYVDDVKVLEYVEEEGNKALKASKMYYVMKTPAEKEEALVGAMESWVKAMAEHLAEKNVVPYGYDVINEAIADGSNQVRGYNGVFGGTWDNDGVTAYDAEPTETDADGLVLNWGSGHFYWGYFVKDYPVRAYQLARKYLPAETKLFYNDYNLETSPSKRAAVIDFVKGIDAANGSPLVDGIGTQCHLTLNVAKDESFDVQIEQFMAQVEASLTDLAATGKLVRITELDISLGTANPAANQLQAQYEAYRRVFEAYKRIVPAAQQSGITIWTLTDHADEHVYWLPDQSPNLFDADGKRKWSYKGVCDGIAGEDLGLKFGGDDYNAWYELKNTGNF